MKCGVFWTNCLKGYTDPPPPETTAIMSLLYFLKCMELWTFCRWGWTTSVCVPPQYIIIINNLLNSWEKHGTYLSSFRPFLPTGCLNNNYFNITGSWVSDTVLLQAGSEGLRNTAKHSDITYGYVNAHVDWNAININIIFENVQSCEPSQTEIRKQHEGRCSVSGVK